MPGTPGNGKENYRFKYLEVRPTIHGVMLYMYAHNKNSLWREFGRVRFHQLEDDNSPTLYAATFSELTNKVESELQKVGMTMEELVKLAICKRAGTT